MLFFKKLFLNLKLLALMKISFFSNPSFHLFFQKSQIMAFQMVSIVINIHTFIFGSSEKKECLSASDADIRFKGSYSQNDFSRPYPLVCIKCLPILLLSTLFYHFPFFDYFFF